MIYLVWLLLLERHGRALGHPFLQGIIVYSELFVKTKGRQHKQAAPGIEEAQIIIKFPNLKDILKKYMLPLGVLNTAKGSPVLVELKNGEAYNGRLIQCDTMMNLLLVDVICTSSDGERFWKMPQCLLRGLNIKYLRMPETVLDNAIRDNERRSHVSHRGGFHGERGSRGGRGGRGSGGYRGGRGGSYLRGEVAPAGQRHGEKIDYPQAHRGSPSSGDGNVNGVRTYGRGSGRGNFSGQGGGRGGSHAPWDA